MSALDGSDVSVVTLTLTKLYKKRRKSGVAHAQTPMQI